MHKHNETEYKSLKDEERHNKSCITEYMAVYYKVVIAVLGAIGIAVSFYIKQSNGGLCDLTNELKSELESNNRRLYDVAGFALLCMALMSHKFSLVILHKCNGHNKIIGYIRVLTRERWKTKFSTILVNNSDQIQLWEIIQQKLGNKEMHKNADTFSWKYIWLLLREAAWGMSAFLRIPIKRVPVKDSWTYPLPLSFGLHVPIIAAIISWVVFIGPKIAAPSYLTVSGVSYTQWFHELVAGNVFDMFTCQFLVCIYLLICLIGNFVRISQLCLDHDGNILSTRTIGAYTRFYSELRRTLLLNHYGVETYPWTSDWDYNLCAQINLTASGIYEAKIYKKHYILPNVNATNDEDTIKDHATCQFTDRDKAKDWIKSEAINLGYQTYYIETSGTLKKIIL